MKAKHNIIRNCLLSKFFILGIFSASSLEALTFQIPASGDIIGQIQKTTVRHGESLGEVGRRFDVGVVEMIEANPGIDPWVPPVGTTVIIPTQFILPKGPRVGIVLNLAEMRLFYYHPDKRLVSTHPVGIGKKGWSTPLGQTYIIGKKKDPTWSPPPAIRREHLAKGDVLPAVVQAGPNNPLGRYAFYLGFKGFLLHGANRPGGVGVRSSHGCIRLLNEDIESLFYSVPIGTSVRIIHEPYKAGWHNGRLYIEVHQPLSESRYHGSSSRQNLVRTIRSAIRQGSHPVNWRNAEMAAEAANGYPTRID